MANKKRHAVAEIAAKLGQADALVAEGRTQGEIAKALGISVMTLHRWRNAAPPPQRSTSANAPTPLYKPIATHSTASEPVARIAELELENTRLRKLVTDLLLEKMSIEDDRQRQLSAGAKTKGDGKSPTS